MEPIDLCVPIYLNQQIVFDLLAVFEDGFSRLSRVRTSAGEVESEKSAVGGSFGVSNVFALLGVSFAAEKGRQKGTKEETEVSQEKVHTPTSLFAKLRLMLRDRGLLQQIETEQAVRELTAGQFVELRAVLRKNPLVETMEALKEIMAMAALFAEKPSGPPPVGKHGKPTRPEDPNQQLVRQVDGFVASLTQSNSLEVVGEVLDVPGTTAVLSTKLDYFSDRNASEIIDGEFRVLGKVVRIIGPDSQDAINLLRKTSFGRVDRKMFEGMKDASVTLREAGLEIPEIVTEIRGPALQVIPIAIFT